MPIDPWEPRLPPDENKPLINRLTVLLRALMRDTILSIQAGTNVTVDNTDPRNPIISAFGGGGGGGVDTIIAGDGIDVDNTVPALPVVSLEAALLDILTSPNIESIAVVSPLDGEILEYSGTLNAWVATDSPRLLYLDGGNF